jgi:hypothetical protein
MAVSAARTNHHSRLDWWRGQFQRQQKANLSVAELCRQLGVSMTRIGANGSQGFTGRASQIFAVLSQLPVTTRDPSGLNDADAMIPLCRFSVRTSAPLFASQIFAVASWLPVTIREPSGLNDVCLMPSMCPLEREKLGAALRVPDLRRPDIIGSRAPLADHPRSYPPGSRS